MDRQVTLAPHEDKAKNVAMTGRQYVRNVPASDNVPDHAASAGQGPSQQETRAQARSQAALDQKVDCEVLKAIDRERNRVGRDLHDGIQGTLVGIDLMLEAVKRRLESNRIDTKHMAGQLDNISHIVRETIRQIRGIAANMCPVDLTGDGLTKAFSLLAATTRNLFGIDCRFLCEETIETMDEVVASQLYYIAHEAVNNARKHAKADRITIRLQSRPECLTLSVEDDGVGLPKGPLPAGGIGLRAMRSRAELIGAALGIRSGATRGTAVECSLSAPCVASGY